MPFRDQLLTMSKLWRTFVYRVEEQRLQKEMGLELEDPNALREVP